MRSPLRAAVKRRVRISSKGQRHAANGGTCTDQLPRAHLLEVLGLQQLAIRKRTLGVDLELVFLLRCWPVGVLEQRLRQSPRQRLVVGRLLGTQARHHERQHLVDEAGIAPEHHERLVEDLALRSPVHEHGVQGPIERALIADAGRNHGFGAKQNLVRPDRQTRGTQQPGEEQDVFGNAATVDVGRDQVRIEPHRTVCRPGRIIVGRLAHSTSLCLAAAAGQPRLSIWFVVIIRPKHAVSYHRVGARHGTIFASPAVAR